VLFTVFNVGHGSCAALFADNGNVALFDSGHDDAVRFRPSYTLPQLGARSIQQLVISHYDEDHVSDLPILLATLPVHAIRTNRLVTTDEIRAIKFRSFEPIGPGVEAALAIANTHATPVIGALALSIDLGDTRIETFSNPYPLFQDTNNLSLVTFIHHPRVSIVIPGDVEKQGWMNLLNDPRFVANLRQVDVFVASHHGRANGYCEDIFVTKPFGIPLCVPEIVIISDTYMQFDTQEHNYAKHATGIRWSDGTVRKVLTTRKDGNITIDTNRPGHNGYWITTQDPDL
jgi:beta-lactamase superfamily II metal-dependent hydrolase